MAREPKDTAPDRAEQPAEAADVAAEAAPAETLQDAPTSADAVSAAPPRPHEGLVSQLQLRWDEMKAFVAELQGDVEGELGAVLAFVRGKL